MNYEYQRLLESYGVDAQGYQQVIDHMFDLKLYEYASRKAYLDERSNPNRDPGYDLRNLNAWRRSYENIRDASWPDCLSPDDFHLLSPHIRHECHYQHGFSADIWLDSTIPFDKFQSDPTWQLDAFDVIRLKLALIDNLPAIKDKNVVDFGTHIGLLGAVCLHNHAEHVIVTNIKNNCLSIADDLLGMLNLSHDRYRAVLSDINDLDQTQALCRDRHTVILAAIMNIVTDHFGIMRAITKHKPNTIIIQNWNPPAIANNPAPLIYWWLEDTTVAWKGYHATDMETRVGCPNKAWFDTILGDFGYHLSKYTLTNIASPFDINATNRFDFLTLVYEL